MTPHTSGAADLPEALRLADLLLSLQTHMGPRRPSHPDDAFAWDGYTKASQELRRLHSENAQQQRELVKESHRTAEQKLRADQMTEQHRHQSELNRDARAQLAALAAGQAVAPEKGITVDFSQAHELLEMFGGEPGLVTLHHGNEKSHSGAGLYAWWTDMPEEGAQFLGAQPDNEAAPARPAPPAMDGGEDAERLLQQILAASQDGDSDTHLSAHFVSRIEKITKPGGAS